MPKLSHAASSNLALLASMLLLAAGCGRAFPGGGPGGGSPDGGSLDGGSLDGGSLDGGSGGGGGGSGGGGGGGGGSGGGVDCERLDERSCRASGVCRVATCPGCEEDIFVSCYHPRRPPPPVACPEPLCAPSCEGLDEASCLARPDCITFGCPCNGSSGFIGCYDLDSPPPPVACEPCLDCARLDIASCVEQPGCQALDCPGCFGASFAVCAAVGEPAACPDVDCPPDECFLLDRAECVAREGCHAVFQPKAGICDCDAPGCCIFFERCVPGPARCQPGEVLCDALPPLCEGPYVVGYTDGCFEGCVLPDECGP